MPDQGLSPQHHKMKVMKLDKLNNTFVYHFQAVFTRIMEVITLEYFATAETVSFLFELFHFSMKHRNLDLTFS